MAGLSFFGGLGVWVFTQTQSEAVLGYCDLDGTGDFLLRLRRLGKISLELLELGRVNLRLRLWSTSTSFLSAIGWYGMAYLFLRFHQSSRVFGRSRFTPELRVYGWFLQRNWNQEKH